MTSEYGYDEEGNLEKLETKQGEVVWLSLQYTYDGEGNRLKRKGKQRGSNGLEEVDTSYTYDEKNQLCEEKNGENTIVYQYDTVGNRIERRSREGEEKYEYNERNQLISFEKGKEKRRFTYDKEGSIIKEERREGEREYAYDAEKKLVRLKREDGREERYGYDGEGKRVAQEGRGRNRRYCYYGQKLLWEEEEGGERKRSYVLGYGIEGVEEEGKRYYYQKDERESTKYISDDEGELRNRYEYDGYGRLEEKEEELAPIFLYTGQEYDEDLEGYWLGERIYREDYGRFLKEDEYEGDGLNLYAYCRNNPIVYYDPSGYMGQPNGTENGKYGTPSEGETKFTADKFPNGFPKPEEENIGEYIEIIKAKIGTQLGDNDIVLGVNEAHYTIFDVKPLNPNRNNILDNHIAEMKNLGYNYNYWVKDIDILYNTSVRKIYFMVDGLQPSENLNKYLRGDEPTESGLRITERELAAVMMREDNFKKTTFCFRGDPIPFPVVQEVLDLPFGYK